MFQDGGCNHFRWVDEISSAGRESELEVDIEALVSFNSTLLAENRELRIEIAEFQPSNVHKMQELGEKVRKQKGKLKTYKEQLEKMRTSAYMYKIVAIIFVSLCVAQKMGIWNV